MLLRRLAAGFFVVAAAATGAVIATIVPAGLRPLDVHQGDFRVTRSAEQPLELTDGRWTLVPLRFPDFDLSMQVELGEGVDLDVLVRQVEPRIDGEEMLPFAGRFSVLRASTVGDGPGWRTRDEAVLGPRGGGIGVTPGVASSVWIAGRGRELTANVAGKKQAPFVADDEYGMFALVARGGKAVVHSLVIENRGRSGEWRYAPWFWASVGGLAAAAAVALAGRLVASGAGLVLGSAVMLLLASRLRAQADLDLAFPPLVALVAGLAGCLLVGLAPALRWPRLRIVCLLVVAAAAAAAMTFADRRLRHDNAAIEAVFGPDAGSQISEAHAQLVRSEAGLLAPQPNEPCVFLLGGQLLYQGNGLPHEHVAFQVHRWLRGAREREVLVPCLPTIDGHCAQQWRLFATCYTGFRPQVLVLGVPRDEMALDANGKRRSSPAQVRDTIAAARAWCVANECKLVVFGDGGLPTELVEVVRAAGRDGVVTVEAVDGRGPADIGRQLGAALEPLVPK